MQQTGRQRLQEVVLACSSLGSMVVDTRQRYTVASATPTLTLAGHDIVTIVECFVSLALPTVTSWHKVALDRLHST